MISNRIQGLRLPTHYPYVQHVTPRTLRYMAEAGRQVCRMLHGGYNYLPRVHGPRSYEDDIGSISPPIRNSGDERHAKLSFNLGGRTIKFYLRESSRNLTC
jgi:hypothetical protein